MDELHKLQQCRNLSCVVYLMWFWQYNIDALFLMQCIPPCNASFAMYLLQCISCNMSHNVSLAMHRLQCISCNESPAMYLLQYVSLAMHRLECVCCNALPGMCLLQCIAWNVSVAIVCALFNVTRELE